MADVTEDLLITELESKQDSLLPLKHGLYSNSEGNEGDMCICINNGKKIFGIKLQGEWNFTELSLDPEAVNKSIINEEVNTNFIALLNRYSANITQIINSQIPRTFNFPFYARSYTYTSSGVSTDNYITDAIIVPGSIDTALLDRLIDGSVTGTLGSAESLRGTVPYKCVLKTVVITATHIAHSTDDRSSTTIGLTGNAYDTSLSSLGTLFQSLTATVAGSFTRYINEDFSNIVIPKHGHFDMILAVTNPTHRKVASLNGIMVFEEVL
jgi:hypothetical protein